MVALFETSGTASNLELSSLLRVFNESSAKM